MLNDIATSTIWHHCTRGTWNFLELISVRRCMCDLADPVFARVGGNDLHELLLIKIVSDIEIFSDFFFAQLHVEACQSVLYDFSTFSHFIQADVKAHMQIYTYMYTYLCIARPTLCSHGLVVIVCMRCFALTFSRMFRIYLRFFFLYAYDNVLRLCNTSWLLQPVSCFARTGVLCNNSMRLCIHIILTFTCF